MGVRNVEEFRAWQYAHRFKLEVYRIVKSSPEARRDFKYRDQLFDAASSIESDIGEGFRRYGARSFALFLTYALSSLKEATIRVNDGIDRGYFTADACLHAIELGQACEHATTNLRDTQLRFGKGRKRPPHRPRPEPPRKPPPPDSSDPSDYLITQAPFTHA